ncbi:MAG: selenoneine synthase SenA [Chloroflexota bacterium]|nr:selenoneine synthase SenA [Chloroflexota bacterium]
MANKGNNVHTLTAKLASDALDSRKRLLELIADFDREQMFGPTMDIVNPPLWEIGHVGWFQERWISRNLDKENPIIPNADELYNSFEVSHDSRWELALPTREDSLAYMQSVMDKALTRLERLRGAAPTEEEAYFHRLTTFHEDMHGEALTYTRQTLGYRPPNLSGIRSDALPTPELSFKLRDIDIPGGSFILGSQISDKVPFVFDNEKWGHVVTIAPFSIANTPVTNEQYQEFVNNKGYERKEFWSTEGWQWKLRENAQHPCYWLPGPIGTWQQRSFDTILPLESHHPVIHITWHEANAYCSWAGRRLPTEAEWEMAASTAPSSGNDTISTEKRIYPWGDEAPTPERANMDSMSLGCVDVRALGDGDSAFGLRQMIGNVWEWCSNGFGPYPGFVIDPYAEYSAPWFWTRKVLRGGAWATRSRLIRNTWRNFFPPDRNDVLAGFRTCALQED